MVKRSVTFAFLPKLKLNYLKQKIFIAKLFYIFAMATRISCASTFQRHFQWAVSDQTSLNTYSMRSEKILNDQFFWYKVIVCICVIATVAKLSICTLQNEILKVHTVWLGCAVNCIYCSIKSIQCCERMRGGKEKEKKVKDVKNELFSHYFSSSIFGPNFEI